MIFCCNNFTRSCFVYDVVLFLTGNVYRMFTRTDQDEFKSITIITSANYLVFRVRACQGARVLLEGAGYVVEIGALDNTAVMISKEPSGEIIRIMPVPEVLSCTRLRYRLLNSFNVMSCQLLTATCLVQCQYDLM